jgi:hypothetical protein
VLLWLLELPETTPTLSAPLFSSSSCSLSSSLAGLQLVCSRSSVSASELKTKMQARTRRVGRHILVISPWPWVPARDVMLDKMAEVTETMVTTLISHPQTALTSGQVELQEVEGPLVAMAGVSKAGVDSRRLLRIPTMASHCLRLELMMKPEGLHLNRE